MSIIKYFFEFLIIIIFFIFFKILGLKFASYVGGKLGNLFGPFFRSNKKIKSNVLRAFPNLETNEIQKITNMMWNNYGRILSEYMFIKKFRRSKFNYNITVIGQEILDKIKNGGEQVIFVSGHFNNFELMAMQIENFGIDVAAIYRPLNNIFLNKPMERIRIKNICNNQIKKGKAGTRKLIEMFKNGYSIALMIDQRVSEGISVKLFNRNCLTTTIPAQLAKKYGCDVVPVYVERINKINFKMYFYEPLNFEKSLSIFEITTKLNNTLEKMILKNTDQWIWSHDRWK